MKKTKLILCLSTLFLLFATSCSAKGVKGDFMTENQDVRLQNVMKKIRKGKPVTVVCMGGSITTGYNSNPIKTNSWAGITETWFNDLTSKNKSSLSFFNRGMSGTDSAFGVVRIDDHVLSKKPDLVILEYAMNDQWLDVKVRQRTYEAILRNVLGKIVMRQFWLYL